MRPLLAAGSIAAFHLDCLGRDGGSASIQLREIVFWDKRVKV